MVKRIRLYSVLVVALCLAFIAIYPGAAQQRMSQSVGILNGDFEGAFVPYGNGEVAQYWQAYDLSPQAGLPQFRRSTWILLHGAASQMFWKDHGLFHSGIMQVVDTSASSSAARTMSGTTYIVRAWTYSIYSSASAPKQHNKIFKRLGIDPNGGTNPQSSSIRWTDWSANGQDKEWIRMECRVEALTNRITVFVEAYNVDIGGQDQVFIDDVSLEVQGGPTPTPTRTATPTPTPTPMIDVLRTIDVGSQPKGIAVMPDYDRFLVANSGDNTVSILDGFLGWRHTRFNSDGHAPSQVAVDPERCRAYVVNTEDNKVTVFNVCLATPRSEGSIALGEDKLPVGIAVLTTTNTIYVANTAASSVSVIDGETLAVTATIAVRPLPSQVTANPRTGKVYVTCRGYPWQNAGAVVVIDGNTGLTKTIGLALQDRVPAPEPDGIAVDPVANLVYVATASGKLVVIDGASDEVLEAIAPPMPSGLSLVAVNPATGNVFVTSMAGGTVFVYDTSDRRWTRTLTLGNGQLGGIAVNPLTWQVLVSSTGQDRVSLIRDYVIRRPYRSFLPIVLQ